MATDLRCPECGDNFGKDKENYTTVQCECGCVINNPEGYDNEEVEDENVDYNFQQTWSSEHVGPPEMYLGDGE